MGIGDILTEEDNDVNSTDFNNNNNSNSNNNNDNDNKKHAIDSKNVDETSDKHAISPYVNDQYRKDDNDNEDGGRDIVINIDNNSNGKPSTTNINNSPGKGSDDDQAHLFFRNIVIMINGYTDPCSTTLMRMVHRHGGRLEKYETDRVTHVIADALSQAKANSYQKGVGGPLRVPVV